MLILPQLLMIYKHQSTLANGMKTAHSRMFAALLLTGILSLFSSLTLLDMVVAAPLKVADTNGSLLLKDQTGNKTTPRLRSQRFRLNRLPANILNAIRQDLTRQSISKLTVVSSKRQNWTNGCLGLGTPEESCLAAIVPGWRVVVSDGSRSWTYRTDSTGRTLRLENKTVTGNSQGNVTNAVLREVSRRTSLPTSAFRIVESQRQNWSNGCLGLSTPGIACTEAIVPGWRIVVANGQQCWVYRTNESGSVVKLDTAASNIGELPKSVIKPTRMTASELPPPIPVNAVFRAIMSGGITGRTYKTTLLNNGQVIRELVNNKGISSQHQTTNISPEQVKEFQSLLETEQFSQFDRLNYDLLRGAADNTNVTLSSRSGTTRYDNTSQDPLPQRLNKVIQAWNRIANRGSFGYLK